MKNTMTENTISNLFKLNDPDAPRYGIGDASFQAAGGEAGIRQLVDDFYVIMSARTESQRIRHMHKQDLSIVTDKLASFLCGWLGGPRLYSEKYGPIQIPRAHAHLDIGEVERDAWLLCMREALVKQPYAEDFKSYLMVQFAIPAERCRTR
jgi:hemoglobin